MIENAAISPTASKKDDPLLTRLQPRPECAQAWVAQEAST
jgi:hypothetical protein